MNRVIVMIRAKVGGKYPYLPAVVKAMDASSRVWHWSAASNGRSKEATTCALPKGANVAGSL